MNRVLLTLMITLVGFCIVFSLPAQEGDPADPDLPPQPPIPTIDEHPGLTREDVFTFSGNAPGSHSVEIVAPTGVTVVRTTKGAFSADVALAPNSVNPLLFTGMGLGGAVSAARRSEIVQDEEPPEIFIDYPADGAVLTTPTVDVAGRVSDRLSGFEGLVVDVNGREAEVDIGIGTNGTFFVAALPLHPEKSTVITAKAIDALGNLRSVDRQAIFLKPPPEAPFMQATSGEGQVGGINETLPEPVVVRVLRGDGTPFASKTVKFEVVRSDGKVGPDPGTGGPCHQVRTDSAGFASAWWTLGSDAGCGNNRVAVTSNSVAGTVVFCASARAGEPSQINVGSGNNQQAEAGSPAFEPLKVWVNDGCNGVPGVPVTFEVLQGGGDFDGAPSIVVPTGPTGHARAPFNTGPDGGVQRVGATFPGFTGNPATFVLKALVREPEAPTTMRGIVIDNGHQPIHGAACRLALASGEVLEVLSDLDGGFVFSDVPESGAATLDVDGSTATRVGGKDGIDVPTGSYPGLHYSLVLVAQARNELPMPVLLPPLDPDNAVVYDGTSDVRLQVEGVEGLEIFVQAGSMRRADGSVPTVEDPAVLSLNQVHHDDVPMPMPDGAGPPFAWTLQPAGATFDPPARVTYPNLSGLAPGSTAYFLSFDHDTEKFEIIGSGRVTADGELILSDEGVGIRKAGWGCNCPPYTITEDCEKCNVKVTGPDEACVGVPGLYKAKVTGDGILTWTVTDGTETSSSSGAVSDGETVELEVTFQTPAGAGGPFSSGNKVEAKLECGDSLSDEHGVGVTSVSPMLSSVKFVSDHGLLRDNDRDFEGTGNVYPEPEWQAGAGGHNHPISHTMDTAPDLELGIELLPETAGSVSFKLEGDGGPGFKFEEDVTLTGGDNTISLQSSEKVRKKIGAMQVAIRWTLSNDDGLCFRGMTGMHTVFVTLGTPRDDSDPRHAVTFNRMRRAVAQAAAAGSLDPHTITETVIQAQGAFDLSKPQKNAWLVPDNGGDCQSIVRFAGKVNSMIRNPGECDHRHIYAIETAPTTAIEESSRHGGLRQDRRPHPTEPWLLALIDGNDGCNAFEAAAKFTSGGVTKYYAGGTDGVFTDPDDVLTVFETLSWVAFEGPPGSRRCVIKEHVHVYR